MVLDPCDIVREIPCMTSHDLLTTGQIARLAVVDPSTVHRWVAKGELPVTTDANGIRLFDRATVEEFLARRAQVQP